MNPTHPRATNPTARATIFVAFVLMILIQPVATNATQMKIAMAQIVCLDGDRAGNLTRIENAVVEAKAAGAELVALPESCVLGWENPAAHQRAEPIPGRDSDELCAMAKKHQVFLCVGLDEKAGANLYGACVLIDDTGHLLLKHRKVNVLQQLMTPPYSEGDGAAMVVDTRFGRVGLLICADSFRPELLEGMAKQRPDLLLIPYGWAAQEEKWPEHGAALTEVVQKAAKTVHCPVVGTDLVGGMTNGPWTGRIYGGQSVAVDREGKILGRGKDRDRDIVLVTVDLDAVKSQPPK